jgi:AmmeMemoRadiSam system protein A
MEPSPLSEPILDTDEAQMALSIADETIAAALAGRTPRLPPLKDLPPALQAPAGAFVTLTVNGELNGCIGTIDPKEPLGTETARLALSAAFSDPRLPQLKASDYPDLDIELSILSPSTPIRVSSRSDLLPELRPYVDGLIIETAATRAVFLPAVWEKLPDPEDFLDQLWLKARLRPGTWPSDLRAQRFTTECHRRHHEGSRARFPSREWRGIGLSGSE